MKKYLLRWTLFIVLSFFISPSWSQSINADKLDMKDSVSIKREVLNHINEIFSAFVLNDTAKIRQMHSQDWVGFGVFSDIKRGLNAYMAPIRKAGKTNMLSYSIQDSEVNIYGDIVAVYYIALIKNSLPGGKELDGQLKVLDLYQRRNGEWIQVGSHTAPRLTYEQFQKMIGN